MRDLLLTLNRLIQLPSLMCRLGSRSTALAVSGHRRFLLLSQIRLLANLLLASRLAANLPRRVPREAEAGAGVGHVLRNCEPHLISVQGDTWWTG